MARLQILQLPEGADDDRPPFILVVDQCVPQRIPLGIEDGYADFWPQLADRIGARGVVVTPETVDIPANEASSQAEPLMRIANSTSGTVRQLAEERDELHSELGLARGQLHSAALSAIRGKHATIHELIERAEQAEAERDEARQWARHRYEIGQRHCGWSDHGVAPAWLTNGLPRAFDSCEHLRHAAALEEALARVHALPTGPDYMDALHPDPTGYQHGYRVAIEDAKRAAQVEEPQASEDGG